MPPVTRLKSYHTAITSMARRFTAASSTYISISKVSSLGATTFTFSGWMNSPLTEAYDSFLTLADILKVYIKSSGKTAVYGNTAYWDGTGTLTLSANTWYHMLAILRAPNIAILYVNAVQDNSQTGDGISAINNYCQFGNDGPGAHYANAMLADPAFWNVELLMPEIRALASGALRPGSIRPQNLRFWYRMEEDGSIVDAANMTPPGVIVTEPIPYRPDPSKLATFRQAQTQQPIIPFKFIGKHMPVTPYTLMGQIWM